MSAAASISLTGIDLAIEGIESDIQQVSVSGPDNLVRVFTPQEVVWKSRSIHEIKVPEEFLQGNSYELKCDVTTPEGTSSFQLDLSAADEAVKKEFEATVTRQARAGIAIAGCADYFDGRELRGWAFYRNKSTDRILVGLYINNRYHSHCIAELMRADLRKKNLGDGCYGFTFLLPQSIYERQDNIICVKPIGAKEAFRKGLLHLNQGAMLDAAFEKLLNRIDRLIEEI